MDFWLRPRSLQLTHSSISCVSTRHSQNSRRPFWHRWVALYNLMRSVSFGRPLQRPLPVGTLRSETGSPLYMGRVGRHVWPYHPPLDPATIMDKINTALREHVFQSFRVLSTHWTNGSRLGWDELAVLCYYSPERPWRGSTPVARVTGKVHHVEQETERKRWLDNTAQHI